METQTIGRSIYQLVCCAAPLVLLGLAVMIFTTVTFITGKGGARIETNTIRPRKTPVSPATTRVLSVIGFVVGFMIFSIGGAVALVVVLMMMGVQ